MDSLLTSRQLDAVFEYLETVDPVREDGTTFRRRHSRRALRVPCRIQFQYVGASNVADARGMTRDISEGGLGIVTQHHLPRGTNLHIRLELPNSHFMELCGSAMQSVPVRLGWYSVGMKFGPVSDPRLLPTVEPGRIHAVIGTPHKASFAPM